MRVEDIIEETKMANSTESDVVAANNSETPANGEVLLLQFCNIFF